MKFIYILLSCFLITACNSDDNGEINPTLPSKTALLQTSGTSIVNETGQTINLRGIGFNNWHWIEDPLPPTTHHSEIDFERVQNMNMNAVRFAMNYWIFEDDANPYNYKQTGWDWLDKNIAWAKKNNVYLILNMHTPQGGYQSQGTGDALWNNVENQNRLVALWVAIAERYKDEPIIAGYGVLNEPIPNQSISQWSTLGQRLVDEIRKVDNHIIFLEQAISVKGASEPDPEFNFPRVTGNNLVFEFHTYQPFQFTHQLMDFSGVGEGGSYPDENIIELGDATWETAIFNNPTITTNTEWQFLEGERYVVEDANAQIGLPLVITGDIGSNGRVNFDDIVVNEYDANGTFIRSINENLLNSATGWDFWSRNDDGNGGTDANDGRTDTNSLYISGATNESNLSNSFAAFEVVQGNSYQISGWVKTDNLKVGGDALFRIDFYNAQGQVQKRNKEYLASILDRMNAWGTAKNVPLYIGEFGTGAPSFENNKGGLTFAEDMVDLILERNMNFTYFDYHSSNFGLYTNSNALPDPSMARKSMIDMLTEKLQ